MTKAWTETHDSAFSRAKDAIAAATLLAHPNPKLPMELWTDASDLAAGVVLVQASEKGWQPLAFWSKAFNKCQKNYSPFDRELLALSYAVDHFRFYLESQPIIVRTDHKPLVGALSKASDTATPLQCHHLNRVAPYVTRLEYLSGAENQLADAF